ncbi:MAG: T9SS type A sorting domain-containing protein, partial [Chitinophagales bacterium]|nr:T9SS type A sorting domain-containing protein [Chitinophagales bacterium]
YEDRGRDIVIDHSGNILLTGFTQSDTGIATPGTWMQEHFFGIDSTGYYSLDVFITKYDTSGKRKWGTYFGDTLSETSRSIAVNSGNEIFVTGATFSNKGIAYNDPYQYSLGGTSDAWYAKFDSTGNLVFSSYFGGSNEEQVGGYGFIIRVDDDDNFYLCSSTASSDSIATPDAYQLQNAGAFDVFIAKFLDTVYYVGDEDILTSTNNQSLNIHPNPAHDFFDLKFNSLENADAVVKIFSVEGKLMLNKIQIVQQGENEFELHLSSMSKGIFLVTVFDGKKIYTAKLMVE